MDTSCELCNEEFSTSSPRRLRLRVPTGAYCRGCIIDLLEEGVDDAAGAEGGSESDGAAESRPPPPPDTSAGELSSDAALLHSAGWQLHHAAKLGELPRLLPLLEHWVGSARVVNWADCDGWTACHHAASNGRTEALKLLLSAPLVEVDALSNNGFTAVMAAARVGQFEAVRLLLARGVDLATIATGGPFKGKTALGLAMKQNRQEIATLLRLAGATLSPKEEEQERALAEERAKPEREKRERERREREAEAAAEKERMRSARQKKEEDKARRERAEQEERERKERERELREREREQRERERERAARVPPLGTGEQIYFAAKSGNITTLRPLLEEWSGHAILRWCSDNEGGYTPLHTASVSGSLAVVGLLCATAGVDVNASDSSGLTALMLAARWGHTECVRVLLAVPGIDLNKVATSGEWKGKTALSLALSLGKAAAASMLRGAGAAEEGEGGARGLARRVFW